MTCLQLLTRCSLASPSSPCSIKRGDLGELISESRSQHTTTDTTRKKSSRMNISLKLLGFALLIAGISCRSVTQQQQEEGKLNVVSLSDSLLEMSYHASPSQAVHIRSEVHNDGETVHLSITTTSSGKFFSVDRASYSSALWSFAGSKFLLLNRTQPGDHAPKFNSYLVPPEYSHLVKQAVNHKKTLRAGLLSQLDHEGVNETGRSRMEEFLMRPEITLLINAAKALGESGVLGEDNQPAMVLYTAALRFSRMVRDINEVEEEGSADIEEEQFPTGRRQKRWWTSHCSNNGYHCTICPIGSGCLGMCGPGCHCWSWVCGHCCYSLGCHAHDLICSIRDQQFSPECIITAPLGIACRIFQFSPLF